MFIGALGDAHGDRFLDRHRDLQRQLANLDLLLLAGDITDRNDLDQYDKVVTRLRAHTSAPMVAVFGNDEYDKSFPEYRRRFDVIFLDDQMVELTVAGRTVRIVGSTGSLDRPTWWQRNHTPHIWSRYRERVARIANLLTREGADLLVLLSHYAPTYRTLAGEREKAFPEMGSLLLEQVLLAKRPDLVVHAHAHHGTAQATVSRAQTNLDDFAGADAITVYNVSLPLVGRVTRFEVDHDHGITVRWQP